jgi:hypothetical protein
VPIGQSTSVWSRMAAVEVNLTVTEPTAHGHLTAWAGDTATPAVSNANFAPGQTVAAHAVVPVSLDPATGQPRIRLRNSAGSTHVVVDVLGWYDHDAVADGLRFMPTPTRRIADTRAGVPRRPVEPQRWVHVPAEQLPPAVAHVLNVTATEGADGGHLTAWDGFSFLGEPPATSTVNFARGEDSPNLTTVTSSDYTLASAGFDTGTEFRGTGVVVAVGTSPVHVVVDHLGFFY